MKYPRFISKKSIIGVPAPSDGADSKAKINRYKNACERFKNLGYDIVISIIYINQIREEVVVPKIEQMK